MQSAVPIAVLGSLLAACGGRPGSAPAAPAPAPVTAAPAAAQLGDGPPLATPGEHMQYRLSLRGIDLATYDLAVGDLTSSTARR